MSSMKVQGNSNNSLLLVAKSTMKVQEYFVKYLLITSYKVKKGTTKKLCQIIHFFLL